MKPIDHRNETFAQVEGRMNALRERVWLFMMNRGGSRTVREWAALMEEELSDVAPRITELGQMHFAKLDGRDGRRGRYRACSAFEAMQEFDRQQRLEREPQLELKL
jgi:hypothetical protein